MSTHIAAQRGEIASRVLMPGDPLRAKYIAEKFLDSPKQYSQVRNMLGFTGTYKGVPVSIQGSGMGMPSMGIYSWELFKEYDVEQVIRIGTAGAFQNDISLGDIILSIAASTDSNFHRAFDLPPSYAPSASWELLKKAATVGDELKLNYRAGNTLSVDAFYDTTDGWFNKWRNMNVLAVEMEAAALYLNAAFHKRDALAMMTISDHILTGEEFTVEQRMYANDNMFKYALEIITR